MFKEDNNISLRASQVKKITDPSAVYKIFFNPGEVTEVRAFGLYGKNKAWEGYARRTVFGYFNDGEEFSKAIHALDTRKAYGVYFTLNPVKKDVLARANNRLRAGKSGSSTSKEDIQCVRWLPIDLDPKRPKDISSTNDELKKAIELQKKITDWLKSKFDIESGILAMSGNGAHILIRIVDTDPKIASPIIKQALQAISERFTNDDVKVDQSVHDPNRIWKAYGTTARKGDNTKDRPHRQAYIFDTGVKTLADVPINSWDKIEKLASLAETNKKIFLTPTTQNNDNVQSSNVDIKKFLKDYGDEIGYLDEKPLEGGSIIYRLKECLFSEEHTTKTTEGDSGFLVCLDGKVLYHCFHDHCKNKTIYDALKKVAGENYKKYILRKNKKEQDKDNEDEGEIILKPITEYKTEEVEWLWYPYLPKGKITLLEGDPGSGKTWLALYICYRLIREDKPIIFCTAEDGIGDTIRNRLEIITAGDDVKPNLNSFFILEGIKNKDNETVGRFTLDNLKPLEKTIKKIKPALIVLDPIQGFLGGKVDINRANEVREKLDGLVKLGEKYGCSFILVRHLAKMNTKKAIYKGLGSIDFSAIARSILLVGQKEKQIILTQHKNSFEEEGKSLAFEIKDGMFLYVGEVNIDSEDILDQETSKSALEEAKDFLIAHLENNPEGRSSKFLFKEAQKNGISRTTLRRAKKELNIVIEKIKDMNGKFKDFIWKIPLTNQHNKEYIGVREEEIQYNATSKVFSISNLVDTTPANEELANLI